MKKILLVIFVFSLLGIGVGQSSAGKNVEDKIGAHLRAQIKEKESFIKAPTSAKYKGLKSLGMKEARKHSVFMHFKKKPNKRQIKSLSRLSVETSESWIPPNNIHKTGFIVAQVPLDKIQKVAKKYYVKKMETAEGVLNPQNDEAAESINAPPVWTQGYSGAGVRIAILDSGLDKSHLDIPTPVVAKDYSNPYYLDDDVNNKITGHGTHVTGSVLGRGTLSGGKYKGMASAADLIFLKIGNDTNSSASFSALTSAIEAATDLYGADIINISYGGLLSYADGSDEISQAVDYANSKGILVCVSAMNEGAKQKHAGGIVEGWGKSDFIKTEIYSDTYLSLSLQWFDGPGVSNDLSLELYDAEKQKITPYLYRDMESSRGTEQLILYQFVNSGNYFLKVVNNSEDEQDFHIYSDNNRVIFSDADSNYTLGTPGVADGSLTVASYTTRTSWTNYLGDVYDYGGTRTIGEISSFSSRGPRIDGEKKPCIAAPGEWIISARDKIVALGGPDYLIIDNDGTNDGNGPADYSISRGTSMSSPIVAGSAALLMEADPSLKRNPDAVKKLLFDTASNSGSWFPDSGWGKINILDAISLISEPTPEPEPTPSPIPTSEPTIPPIPTPIETPEPIPSPTPEVTPPHSCPSPILSPSPSPEQTPIPTETPKPMPSPTPTVADEGGGGGYEPPKDFFEVQKTYPEKEADEVEINTNIILSFNQNINGDELALDRKGSEVEFRVENTEINLPVTLDVQGKNLIVNPSEPLKPGMSYTFKIFWWGIKAANAAGTNMKNDFKTSFKTANEFPSKE